MKKKIFLACLAFCLYNAFLMGIHMVMILSEPIAWSPAVRTVFGYAARIQIVERNRNLLYLELCDNRPEDKIKMKSTILDRDVYEKESETDIFYRDKVFYSYGSAGFYTIYANPFRIKVYRNPSQPLEEKQEIDRSLAKYSSDEIQVISSVSDLASEERKAYEKLRVKADNKEGR